MTQLINRAISLQGSQTPQKLDAKIIPKEQHSLRKSDLSRETMVVLENLLEHGFDAYVVGGCIRDKLLGIQPKDFDVVTNATPEEINKIFRNCRLIGRRFRLAHIHFGREIIEVATYRGHHTDTSSEAKVKSDKTNTQGLSKDGQILRDNVFGTIEEDAARRDFTFNAMYFDIRNESILDFADGFQSVQNHQIAMIGDVETRFQEDPVRMLRAIRFAVKLGMKLSVEYQQVIKDKAHLLIKIPPARLFEEVNKLLLAGFGENSFTLLCELNIFSVLFPQVDLAQLDSKAYVIIKDMLHNTDERLANDLRVTPAFLYATALWYSVEERASALMFDSNMTKYDAFNIAGMDVLHRQNQRVMIPKRFSTTVRDIWALQYRLEKRAGKRPFMLVGHPKFRAAYDFLLLRGKIEGGRILELAEWWTDFQKANDTQRKKMLPKGKRRTSSKRKR